MNNQPYIIQWNLNGLKTRLRLGELQRLLINYEPVCLCLQHIGQYDTAIKNYTLASQSIKTNDELGTAIYVRNNITFEKIQILNSDMQYSATKLYLGNGKKLTVCNMYNQPFYHYNLTTIKTILTTLTQPVLLVGDFNAHNPLWDENCNDADEPGRKIEELLEERNMQCLNEDDSHTYVSRTNGAISSIDLAMCSREVMNQLEWRVIEDNYTSDHQPILITYMQQLNSVNVVRYKTDKAEWTKYKAHLESNLPEYDETMSVEEAYKNLKENIIKAADESIPKSAATTKKREVPWWNHELQELANEKHKIGNKMIRTKKKLNKLLNQNNHNQEQMSKIIILSSELKVIRPILNKVTAKFKRKVLIEKSESWKKYVTSINSKTPIKKIWRRFKKVTNSSTKSPKHALIVNGQKIHETKEICNAIAERIEQTSSDAFYEHEFLRYKNEQERTEINFEVRNPPEYYNLPLTEEELHNALDNSRNTAPGKDQINFEMIKELPQNAKTYLLKIYNQIWNSNEFPNEWREAIIIPIAKPGKDASNPGNYRPISLTSCLCKTMEKIVNIRLTQVLRDTNAITPTQTGAERGRSTLEPLIQMEEHIREAFCSKKTTIAIYFDIERAYDSTWRHQILKKMQEVGIKGQLGTFIKNFMKDRSFQVRIENTLSETYTQKNGIIQGSVLSCTLFKLAINSIVKSLPRQVQNSLFMDDYGIYISAKHPRQAERMLNIVLKKLRKWSQITGFKFSIDKTKAVVYYKNKRWLKDHIIQLKLGENVIPIVEDHKFLGVYFDSHLNFKKHVDYIRGKCKKALNLLRKVSHTKWGADRKTLKMLYKATVRAILDYGCQVYGSASKATLARLDPIHNEGMRQVTGAFRSSPAVSLQVESGELPLQLHRELTTMKSKLNFQNNNSPIIKLLNKRDTYWKPDGREDAAPYPARVNRLYNEMDISTLTPTYPVTPPLWTCRRAKFCFSLINIGKRHNAPQVNRQHALRHISRKERHYAIFTDGSKTDQKVGCAAVSTQENNKVSLPGNATICTAEIWAIGLALDTVRNTEYRNYIIYSDSKSALEAIKRFQPENHIIAHIITRIHELQTTGKQIQFCWIPSHAGVAGNEYADKEAKEVANQHPIDAVIPPKDYASAIRKATYTKWQRMWETVTADNKLKSIKQNVGEWRSSTNEERATEVTMTRLRIGHTHATHSHLMSLPHGPPPACERCGAQLSVKHIMKECPNTKRTRTRYFGNKDIKEILGEEPQSSVNKVILFLREIEMHNKI